VTRRLRGPALAGLLSLLFAAPAFGQGAQPILDPLKPSYGVDPPPDPDTVPRGFVLNERRAVRIARRVPYVRDQVRTGEKLEGATFLRPAQRQWVVVFSPAGRPPDAEIVISGVSGRVVRTWTGIPAAWDMARGDLEPWGGKLHAPYIFLPLCVLFFAVFFDRRRPFRLLHFDLLALLGFGLSLWFFGRGEVEVSVPLQYPFLVYLLVRMVVVGYRRTRGDGQLVPWVPYRVLVVLAVVLLTGRIALNVAEASVPTDIAYAGVVGADRIVNGEELYVLNDVHGDTYGPLNYAAYVPFELLFPFEGRWDELPAAHAAAITFDLAAVLGLVVLARRLRPGRQGKQLAAALAFAWAAYPFTALVQLSNTNDGLVAAVLIWALVVVHNPVARGVALAAAALTKFLPIVLAPLYASGRRRNLRDWSVFSLVFAAVVAGAILAFLPPGGVREFYDTTIGFQLGRESPFSLWGQHPSLDWLQTLVKVGAVGLAVAVAIVGRVRSPAQVAALSAAVLIAFQLTVTHWFYPYVSWFAGLALVALFAQYPLQGLRTRPRSADNPVAIPPALDYRGPGPNEQRRTFAAENL